MPRGRTPKSAAEKRLQGNAGKRPIAPEGDAPPSGDALRCPMWLDKRARMKWRQLAPKLLALGLLSTLDGETLSIACQCWAEFRLATEALGKSRAWGKPDAPGLVNQQRSAWTGWIKYSALFGLDPYARVRVKPPPQADPEDELEALAKRAKGDT